MPPGPRPADPRTEIGPTLVAIIATNADIIGR
jgi:hypothetical protein